MKGQLLLALGATILALLALGSLFGCVAPSVTPDIGPWYQVTGDMKCRRHYYADRYTSEIECLTVVREK